MLIKHLIDADLPQSGFSVKPFVKPVRECHTWIDDVDPHPAGSIRRCQTDTGQHQSSVGGTTCLMRGRRHLTPGANNVDYGTLAALTHSLDDRVYGVDVGKELGLHSLMPSFWI